MQYGLSTRIRYVTLHFIIRDRRGPASLRYRNRFDDLRLSVDKIWGRLTADG